MITYTPFIVYGCCQTLARGLRSSCEMGDGKKDKKKPLEYARAPGAACTVMFFAKNTPSVVAGGADATHYLVLTECVECTSRALARIFSGYNVFYM